jgi:hypothetical protein
LRLFDPKKTGIEGSLILNFVETETTRIPEF